MEGWQDYVGTLVAACDGLLVTDQAGELSSGEGLRRWILHYRVDHYVAAYGECA